MSFLYKLRLSTCTSIISNFIVNVLSFTLLRGLLAIEVLRVIEATTGKQIHELFDFICGVSTGSILAFLIGIKAIPLFYSLTMSTH